MIDWVAKGNSAISLAAAPAYRGWLKAVFDFQPLISGVLAVAAAVATAAVIWRAARLPIEAQARLDRELKQRRLSFAYVTLGHEWRALSAMTRQVDATMTVVIAANATVNDDTRSRCYLHRHPIVGKWAFMSLLDPGLFEQIGHLYRLIDEHNFDIDRAGGAFGSENFRQSIRGRLLAIRGLTATLGGQVDQRLRGISLSGSLKA